MTNSEHKSINTLLNVIENLDTSFSNMSRLYGIVQSEFDYLPNSKMYEDTIILKNDNFNHQVEIHSIKLKMIKDEMDIVYGSLYDKIIPVDELQKWSWLRLPDTPHMSPDSEYWSINVLLKVVEDLDIIFSNMSRLYVLVHNNLNGVESNLNHLHVSELEEIKHTILSKKDNFNHRVNIITLELKIFKGEMDMVYDSIYDKIEPND